MKRSLGSLLRLSLVAMLCTSCATSAFLAYKVSPDYPRADREESLELPGFIAPVRVLYDELGVPHVQAANLPDMVRAAGFVQARDRYFQMDAMRRLAMGRLSELVGEQPILGGTTVLWDAKMRSWGFEEAARSNAERMEPDVRAILDAYTAGANQALEHYKPLEYRLLRVDPEPWTNADTLAVGLLTAWSVSHNWHQETSRLLFALQVGWERAEAIYPSEPWKGPVSLPSDAEPRELPPAVAEPLRALFPARPWEERPADSTKDPSVAGAMAVAFTGASNAWVVGGARSASGAPVLANDPHMTHMAPSLVYQQHLSCPGFDAIGVTAAGLPFNWSGHNRDVAWGVTSTVGDVIDLFIEQVDPEDPTRVRSLDGGWAKIEEVEMIIGVRDGGTVNEKRVTLRRSPNGYLLNDMFPDLLPPWAPPVAIRWDLADTSEGIRGLLDVNRAKSLDELRAAFADLVTPVQTVTAADRHGNVGLFAVGRLPKRSHHRGTFPAPGWLPEYQWSRVIAYDELPYGQGTGDIMLAHGNNLMVNPRQHDGAPCIDSAPSYRHDRILALLAAEPKHTVETFRAIQADVMLHRGRRLTPHLLADLADDEDLSPIEGEALSLLRAWDYVADVDSAATAIFFTTYRAAATKAIEDELDAAGFAFIMGQRYSTNVADQWIEGLDHVVWDDRRTPDRVETRAEVTRAAFREGVAFLAAQQGEDPKAWAWGALHDINAKHAFGSKKALADYVNMPASPVGGGLDSVWKSHFDLGHPKHPYRAVAGPVYRMIVDMSDLDHGQWIIDTGSSGWPGSPHYADQHAQWLKGDYAPMRFNWKEIEETAVGSLRLTPLTGN